jgi:hypothetical protein
MKQDRSAEIENPDTEVQDVCEEIGGTVEGAYDLLLERRDSAYAAETKPLDTERAALQQEHASIGQATQALRELLPARARQAQFEADRLTLEGKREEAAAKLAEQREAEAAPGAMSARQREILTRIDALDSERRAVAKRIFESWFVECQAVVRASEHGLFCTLLDGLKASFYEYQDRTGTGGTIAEPYSFLVKSFYLENLTADAHSEEWQAARKWYGGRGR